jgi:2-C-methyl-D-erythritol 2,4-cyclodiphosphate synthase
MKIRVGMGFDVHQLKDGTEFWIGGIHIPHPKGATGHSDADVLIHAICDALLGAANLRDIGYHFSDKDPKFKGIDSKILLEEVVKLLQNDGWKIGNVDATLVLEAPKINPHVEAMKATLAPIMQVETGDVSIKATTNERMGFIGREEGVTAYAVALITK